jgi:hypothetical protein
VAFPRTRKAGRDDDVDRRFRRDPLHPRDVTAESPHGGIDDRPDALGVHGVQLLDGARDHGLLVPPVAAVVLHVLGGEHEDVLVHQGLAQVAQVDRAPHGLDDCHSDPLSDGCAEPFKGS